MEPRTHRLLLSSLVLGSLLPAHAAKPQITEPTGTTPMLSVEDSLKTFVLPPGYRQDDQGKPWFVNAGGERGPLNFQQPIVYGSFNTGDQFAEGYKEVHPLVGIPDVQGGTRRFGPDEKTLNHFTATCGQEIVRGDRMPEDLRGDLLFSEPVGRLIRRSRIEVRDGVTPTTVRHALADSAPKVRAAAIRVSETLFKGGDESLVPDLQKIASDSDAQVATQAMLTARHLNLPDWKALVIDTMASNSARGVQEVGNPFREAVASQPQNSTRLGWFNTTGVRRFTNPSVSHVTALTVAER